MAAKKQTVAVNGHKVNLTNLDKLLYPDSGIVKAQIIQYNMGIAPYLLEFGQQRPLSLIRYPDGILAHQFYAKNMPDWTPDWVHTTLDIDGENKYMILKGIQDLVWLANLAALEIHGMNKTFDDDFLMDHIVFDLDPPSNFSYEDLKMLAIDIGAFLKTLGMTPFVKTSGSRGAHIYIPIVPTAEFDKAILQIKLIAKKITNKFPEKTTSFFRKDKRKGKILIDINRNFEAQTTILPFSTRARKGAPVSMPLTWEAFESTQSSQDFNIQNALDHLKANGNPWGNIMDHKIDLLSLQLSEKKSVKPSQKSKPTEKKAIKQPKWFSHPKDKHMLAGVSLTVLEKDQYVYENKWDGIRVFVYISKGEMKIMSRGGRDITTTFPDIADRNIPRDISCILDGEIVVQDEKGRPDFGRVISRMHSKSASSVQTSKNPAIFYGFDILRKGSKLLLSLPWAKRRKELETVLNQISHLQVSQVVTEGQLLFEAGRQMDLEGIMIKDTKAPYLMGQRSDAWLKVKYRSDSECFIIGYTTGEGKRTNVFGSLHIAEMKDGAWVYRGKVGTGFNDSLLEIIYALLLKIPEGPKLIQESIEEVDRTKWLAGPFPYCKIEYAKLTSNNTYREPVFKGLLEKFENA